MIRYLFFINCILMCFLFFSSVQSAEKNILNPVTSDLPKTIETKPLVSEELQNLEELILATESSLKTQKNLKEKIKEYQALQTRTMQDVDNIELLYKLAQSANGILVTINENHLTHIFEPSFLSELSLISKPAAKRGIPRP